MKYLFCAAVLFLTDSCLKAKAEKNKAAKEKEMAGGRLVMTRYHNYGAFLNLLEKKRELLLAVSGALFGILLLLAALIYPKKGRRAAKLGLALLIGGSASNLSDRIRKGYVVDYFYFTGKCFEKGTHSSGKSGRKRHIIFNLADFGIFLGSLLAAADQITR